MISARLGFGVALCLFLSLVSAGWQDPTTSHEQYVRRHSRRSARLGRRQNGPSAVPTISGEIVTSRYIGCPTYPSETLQFRYIYGRTGSGTTYLRCAYSGAADCDFDSNGQLVGGGAIFCPLTSSSILEEGSTTDAFTYTVCPLTDSNGATLAEHSATSIVPFAVQGFTNRNYLYCYYNNGDVCGYSLTTGLYVPGSSEPGGADFPPKCTSATQAADSSGYLGAYNG